MPSPTEITPTQRKRLAARLSQAIVDTGLSRRQVAHQVAKARKSPPTTMESNLKRWSASKPREGAIDAPPSWIFAAVKKIKAPPAQTPPQVEKALRECIDKGYVSLSLASAAADAIRQLTKKKTPAK